MPTTAYAGNRPMSRKSLNDKNKTGTLADAQYILGRIRATIASIRYLGYKGTPKVNSFLTTIINDVGAQWRLSQRIHNVNHPDDQTAISDFWSEWVKDFFINFVTKNAKDFCREAIDLVRETWTNSADAGAQEILDALISLESQMGEMTIDTSL